MATTAEQAEFDNSLRLYTYRQVVASGKAPAVAQAAAELGSNEAEVRAGYARLSESHACMLTESGELWRAAPFSAIPTPFPVESGGQTYYANCIWDALGIPAMLGQDATIPASCACCNLEMTLQVTAGSLLQHEGLIHVAVPARRWYEDVSLPERLFSCSGRNSTWADGAGSGSASRAEISPCSRAGSWLDYGMAVG